MARKEQITCDVCGAQKQDTNHWFVVVSGDTGTGVVTDQQYRDLIEKVPPFVITVDCCGEACVLKKVSELIGK